MKRKGIILSAIPGVLILGLYAISVKTGRRVDDAEEIISGDVDRQPEQRMETQLEQGRLKEAEARKAQ